MPLSLWLMPGWKEGLDLGRGRALQGANAPTDGPPRRESSLGPRRGPFAVPAGAGGTLGRVALRRGLEKRSRLSFQATPSAIDLGGSSTGWTVCPCPERSQSRADDALENPK